MKSVLITGAGRGIGRAAALHLARDGWQVFAGVRDLAAGEALAKEAGNGASITPLALDVTDQAQIDAAAGAVPATLDALINNAGIAVDGPVEALTTERLQEQFSVNVYGAIAMTRAVMPKIRAAKGRVLFISSVSGRIATPWTGAYNGSKYAIEGLADAMRIEVAPWGVRVVLIEPSNTDTDMWGEAGNVLDATVAGLSESERSLYAKHIKGMKRTIGVMQKTAVPADHVVKRIDKALTAKRPKARYPIGLPSRTQLILSSLTPQPIEDWVLARATGVPRKA